ncbi:MAG: hypothetical protein CBB97_09360 [Candidatus Endolissoclinum sp. TMED37]|nr:MAG: hypothetical protein CBB97_09360 [Candidatus Endolissoclinum sp. TMED37]|tara:strand:- start:101 stop:343 length:243 start_codon:yes stop_codon:yes gene_type:complete
MKANLKQLIELAKDSTISDPIDWESVNLNEDTVYEMIGMSVIEMMHKIDKNEHKDVMMAASLLKLTVENFVLHLKLKNKI